MLDVLGDDYIAQHVSYQASREDEERAFRIYLTDAVFAAKLTTRRWIDIVEDAKKPQETRSGEEIKHYMLLKLNG